MLEGTCRTIAFSVQKNRAEFQSGIVCDAELPIGCDTVFGGQKIPVDYTEEISNLFPAGLMRLQPAVFNPLR